MTKDEIMREADFIHARVNFLDSQPRDAEGMLLSLDQRLEAGTIIRRIEELEMIALAL